MTKGLLTLLGAVVFNGLFWQEKLGLNTAFFSVFILAAVLYCYRGAWAKPGVRLLLLLHVVTLGAVLLHNTLLSKLAFTTTLLLFVVFVQYVHRSVWYAAGSVLLNITMMLVSFVQSLRPMGNRRLPKTGIRKALRFVVIPLMILGLFMGIYALANAVFREVLGDLGLALERLMNHLFTWLSWPRLFFLLFGLFVTGALLLRSGVVFFSEADLGQVNDLYRKKRDFRGWLHSGWADLLRMFMGRVAQSILALQYENKVGVLSLVLLNVLLLVINCIDVVYVWFGFTYDGQLNLSEYVHEGTGLLILSILLAMGVLLFFFRGNLNFYTKNRWLRYGATAWIVQNMILVVSVFIRDYYYFVHMGLAYKRIGVVVFLLLVAVGLITVFIKIHWRKTNYYLLRVNAWAVILVFALCSTIDWDLWIAEHNLARKDRIPVDINFLLTLSDRTLPVIQQHPEVLDTAFLQKKNEVDFMYERRMSPSAYFTMRKKDFFSAQQGYTWLSWNRSDAFVLANLAKPVTNADISR